MSRARAFAVVCALITALCTGAAFAGDSKPPADVRQGYRFVVKSEDGKRMVIRGLITVDGKDRLIEHENTPYEFRCEGGAVVAGYFEAIEAGRLMRMFLYDPVYSKHHPAVTMKGYERVRFSWAQPGAGPRCADDGQGSCPSTTPSIEEFKKRLAALQAAGPEG
jgi:hypothetical protein